MGSSNLLENNKFDFIEFDRDGFGRISVNNKQSRFSWELNIAEKMITTKGIEPKPSKGKIPICR